MQAHILSIGDEVLIGQIVNTNSVWMAQQLNLCGIAVQGMSTVSDSPEAIIAGLEQGLAQADIVLMTGGLGPTKDDLTKKVLADYFGLPLVFHAPSFENIERILAGFGRQADERYRVQAEMPQGADILINKMGTASGMWFERGGKIAVSMPGVPREMQYLMSEEVLPRLQQRFAMPTILHRTLLSTGKGETDLSEQLEGFEAQLPAHIKLAYLPDTMEGRVRLRLSAKGADKAVLEAEIEAQSQALRQALGERIFYGYEQDSLESVVGKLLQAKGWTIGTAESCTAGLVSHKLGSIPGSSAYLQGSVVAYSNRIKQEILGVSPEILEEHGAVSEATVKAMLSGLLQRFGLDCGIAVSGIAGPDGARPGKPVGTIWLAYGSLDNLQTKLLQLGGDRERNVRLATNHALNLLRLWLQDIGL